MKILKAVKVGFLGGLCACVMMFSIPDVFAADVESETGLVAYWKFDEGSGARLADSSGNFNRGTSLGASWVDGKFGKALHFNGKDDYVDCRNTASFAPESNITVSLWGKRDSRISWADAFITKAHGGWTASYAIRESRFIINFVTQGEKTVYFGDQPFGVWTHYAFTYDGSKMRGYINGVEVAKSPVSVTDTIKYSSAPLIIGAHGSTGAGSLNGAIDEVRIYNKALSAEQIKELYQKSDIL
ncbi:MAG: LamG domain-containing protein [bacterium]|nr:LamG domain-containing protein [bacterium]